MKTISALIAVALLFTIFAWTSLSGDSRAAGSDAITVPLAEAPKTDPQDKVTVHRPAPIRATAPATPPPAPKSEAMRAFQAALDASDLCEVSRLMTRTNPADIISAMLATISPGSALQEAFAADGPLLGTSPPAEKKKDGQASTEFLWALKLSGQIYAPSNTPEDLKAARELLLALEKKDAGNAIYPYFRLGVEEKLAYTADQLLETSRKIASGSSFRSPLRELDEELTNAAWLSPAHYQAMQYNGKGYSVSFYSPQASLQRLAGEKKFDGLPRIAELMAEEGLRAHRPQTAAGYDVYQYYASQALAPEGTFPDISALDAEKNQRQLPYPSHPWQTDPLTAEQRCDPGPYEAYFFELREMR